MASTLERFREDLTKLVKQGQRLRLSMKLRCFPEKYTAAFKERYGDEADAIIKDLPDFIAEYQRWYSEALVLLEQLLPSRVADFTRHYERPKNRKNLTNETYRIEDYLQGLSATLGYQKIASPEAAVPQFDQQLAILYTAFVAERIQRFYQIRNEALRRVRSIDFMSDDDSFKIRRTNPQLGEAQREFVLLSSELYGLGHTRAGSAINKMVDEFIPIISAHSIPPNFDETYS